MILLVFSGVSFGIAANNPVIYAPQIAPITVDGSFSDWQNASNWAEFGAWYPQEDPGLTSTSRAKYAWNNDSNLMYIAIESTEGTGLILEVGGLYGFTGQPDPTVIVHTSPKATQISFNNWSGGTATITNQYAHLGEITNGVQVGYLFDGQTMRIEIATPIYSDWTNVSSKMDLTLQTGVYQYANVADEWWEYADSQVADGNYISLNDHSLVEVASLIILNETAGPESCDDIPNYMKNRVDLNGDCYVDFIDFSLLASSWMSCNDPEDIQCQD
jgi:hypothetical protein